MPNQVQRALKNPYISYPHSTTRTRRERERKREREVGYLEDVFSGNAPDLRLEQVEAVETAIGGNEVSFACVNGSFCHVLHVGLV